MRTPASRRWRVSRRCVLGIVLVLSFQWLTATGYPYRARGPARGSVKPTLSLPERQSACQIMNEHRVPSIGRDPGDLGITV